MLRLWRLSFVLAVGLTLYATLTPMRGHSVGFPGLDKIVHASLFALNALCGVMSFSRRGRVPVLIGLVALGTVTEVMQAYVPTRFPSLADAIANWVGIVLGALGANRIAPGSSGAVSLDGGSH